MELDERTMMDLSALPLSVSLPFGFLAGLLVGYLHFCALRHTADLIVRQGNPLLGLALTLGRFALLACAFYVAVLAGGLALLAALAGVLCAKAGMLRQVRSDTP